MILSRFKWYRRMRGGYWAKVPGFLGSRWTRVDRPIPAPTPGWEFYPWAAKTLGNGYVDEWWSVEPCYAVAFSQVVAGTLGTNDLGDMLELVRAARTASEYMTPGSEHSPYHSVARARLEAALFPFVAAKTELP